MIYPFPKKRTPNIAIRHACSYAWSQITGTLFFRLVGHVAHMLNRLFMIEYKPIQRTTGLFVVVIGFIVMDQPFAMSCIALSVTSQFRHQSLISNTIFNRPTISITLSFGCTVLLFWLLRRVTIEVVSSSLSPGQ